MSFREPKILIWVLSWATLLLIIIYSPIGSPDLYIHRKYVIRYQNVNFNEGIKNASGVRNVQMNEQSDISLATYTPENKNYSYKSLGKAAGVANQSSYIVATSTNSRNDQNITNSGGAESYLHISSSGRTPRNNLTSQTVSNSSLSSDFAMDDKSTTARQLASTSVMEGGTDPGDDPTTPPIPFL